MLAVEYDTPEWSLPAVPTCEVSAEEPCRGRAPGQPRLWCGGCRREKTYDRVRVWLRSQDWPTVLSITSYDAGGGSRKPDRRYDPIAVDADLRRALELLPCLERAAGDLAPLSAPKHLAWHWWVDRQMQRRAGPPWADWQVWITEQRAPDGGFMGSGNHHELMVACWNVLFDRTVLLMVETLGEWY